MSTLQVKLFHRFDARFQDEQVRLEGSKVQELFAFLILFGAKFHSRESLSDLLWRETPDRQSRRYLSKALWQLQNSLEATTSVTFVDLFQVESDWIRFTPNDHVSVDAAMLETAYQSIQGIPGAALTAAQFAFLQSAADLYQGELLEGWYHDWCLQERQRFHYIYLAILDRLIDYSQAHHAFEVGLGYCMAVLQHDPTRERAHRQAMFLLYLSGDRSAALQHFAYCQEILHKELNVEPDTQTCALYEQIKASHPIAAGNPTPNADLTLHAHIALLRDEFLHLQTDLAAIQQRVEKNMELLQQLAQITT